MSSETALSHVPSEIWIYIQRFATADSAPRTLAYSNRYQYEPLSDPFRDIQEFLRDACSFALVNKLWNALANEIVYENITVDDRFNSLYDALQRPGTANLVRTIRLSGTRFNHNQSILARCARVEIIVQSDVPPYFAGSIFRADLNVDLLPHLKHIYWRETNGASGLLRKLAQVAPNLEYIFLLDSNVKSERSDRPLGLPPIPTLRKLGVGIFESSAIASVLGIDLQRLTSLHCHPSLLTNPAFPAQLPLLRTLHLFGSRSLINFETLLGRLPRLQELCYDLWNPLLPPTGGEHARAPLSLIRLHSAVTVIRDWSPIENHFSLFLSLGFPRVKRIVLHNSWHRVVKDARFLRFGRDLRARGCQLEFPEGNVLS